MFSGNSWCTCEQYLDLDTTCRSFIIGWDWETSGDVAWMTAVNSWPGMIPAIMEDLENWDCYRKLRLWSWLPVNGELWMFKYNISDVLVWLNLGHFCALDHAAALRCYPATLSSHLLWKKCIGCVLWKGLFTQLVYPFFMLTKVQIVERVMSQMDWVFRQHQKTPRQRIPHEFIPWDVAIHSVLDDLTDSNSESVYCVYTPQDVHYFPSVFPVFPVYSTPFQIMSSHTFLNLASRGQCLLMPFMQNQHCVWQLTWRHNTKWVLMMWSILILVLISPDSPCQINSA